MKKYLVEVRGENFQLTGETRLLAFLTARFVEASDEETAGREAFNDVRNDARLTERVRFEPGDAPRVFIELVREIAEFPADTNALTGLIFYDDEKLES